MTHVVIYPTDNGGCGMYRLRWPGEACLAKGNLVTIGTGPPKIALDNHSNVRGISVGSADVVVFQRPGSYQMPQVIDILHDNGVKVVIDMDDSLSKIDQRNPVYKEYDPRLNHKRNHMLVAQSCDMADLVTVTTEALAEEYGGHGRVQIIPNHVPARYLNIPRQENEVPIITWAGFTKTHPGDLSVTAGAINQVVTDTGASFMAFGNEEIFRELQVRNRPPNFHQPFSSSIFTYPNDLIKADIGIVPLRKTPFNEGKSWLKCLEYASLGIVPVATDTPDNRKFAELGGCVLIEKNSDWHRTIKDLVLDNDKRAELSKKVREVAAEWTYEENWNKWWSAWETTQT